jgi:hypothetical protein
MDHTYLDKHFYKIHNDYINDTYHTMAYMTNANYNKNILYKSNLFEELLNIIFSQLSLQSLICCALTCNKFLECSKKVMVLDKKIIDNHREFNILFSDKNNEFLSMIRNNLKVLVIDDTINYLKCNKVIGNCLLNLKNIVLYVNFPDQLNILKLLECKKYDIVIRVCEYGDKCYLCLRREIYADMNKICSRFVMYHQNKLFK